MVLGKLLQSNYSISNFIETMSKIPDRYSVKNKIGMQEIKSAMLKSNYEVDIGLKPKPNAHQNSLFHNPELPYFKGPSLGNHYMNTSQASQTTNKNDSSSKRLKLKDYLHLNSIQKKSKSRTCNSISLIDSEASLKTEQKTTKHNRMKTASLIATQSTSSKQTDYIQVFKTQINQQIQIEIKRLQDIAHYLKYDHIRNPNQKEDKILFCQIHSTLEKGAKMHDKLGQHILQIQEKEPQKNRNDKDKYFWEKNSKKLSSPAKLKEGLDLTCLLFGTFAEGETKDK